MNEEKIQILKFSIIGASGVLVNMTILYLALFFFNEEIALAFAIFFSMTTNYILNRIWTFESTGSLFAEYIKYLLGASLGSLVQYIVTLLLHKVFVRNGFETIFFFSFSIKVIFFANLIGIFIGFILNFLFSKYFVFTSTN